MNDSAIIIVIEELTKDLESLGIPIVSQLAEDNRGPFAILISTILSLRTKDEVTAVAAEKLLELAGTPEAMLKLSADRIIKAIYPVGFYRKKTRVILDICQDLIDRFHSQVPDTIENLLTLKGVGRKTANLVVSLGYNKDGLCVDTHVHRISNRLGYINTKTPEQTEYALREKLPRKYWSIYNTLLVAFGKHVCLPVSPFCSKCRVNVYCDRVNVVKSR
jgi:endonuclease III